MARTQSAIVFAFIIAAAAAVDWSKGNWAFKCDFPKSADLKVVNTDCSQCGQQCWNNDGAGCTHWTCNNNQCKLKKGSVTKSAAVDSGDQFRTCGINREAAGGAPSGSSAPAPASTGTATGKTTRYWDCCKPSCSWPGKVQGATPVKTCAKDGVTKIDANTKSGCEGGDSYVCNDQVPMVVNNTMAYGFVAGNVAGKPEQETCCACYKIDFTSGPVVGKSMIVQLTNIGSDLSSNHFDIQIPGGGVGIFNGCSRQWGAPGDGWGQRYGGVSSAAECDKLPAQIREGCKFRFGWFKGADNPTMKLKRVRCPDQIVQKTQCRRPDDSKF